MSSPRRSARIALASPTSTASNMTDFDDPFDASATCAKSASAVPRPDLVLHRTLSIQVLWLCLEPLFSDTMAVPLERVCEVLHTLFERASESTEGVGHVLPPEAQDLYRLLLSSSNATGNSAMTFVYIVRYFLDEMTARKLQRDTSTDKNLFPTLPLVLWSLIRFAMNLDIKDAVEVLMEVNADIDATDTSGTTALMYAAQIGDFRVVQLLIAAGARLGAVDDDGATALALACAAGQVKVVNVLLAAGAASKERKRGKDSVLVGAVRAGQVDVVRALLQAKVSPQQSGKHSETALHVATRHHDPRIAEMLLAAGADANHPDRYNRPPLMLAASQRNAPVVRLLLEAKANASFRDSYGMTPMRLALRSGDTDTVQALIAAGVDCTTTTANRATPLSVAVLNNNAAMAQALLQARADAQQRHWGRPLLMLAVERGYDTVVRTLLQAKASFEQPGDSGDKSASLHTPLMIAAEHGRGPMVRALLQMRADANAKTKSGVSALVAAVRNTTFDVAEVVQVLVDAKADVNVKPKQGDMAIHAAIRNRHLRAAQTLARARADVNIQRQGCTPLLLAVEAGSLHAVRLLLDAKADANGQGRDAITPLQLALKADSNNTQMVRTLLAANADPDDCVREDSNTLLEAVSARQYHLVPLLPVGWVMAELRCNYTEDVLLEVIADAREDAVKVLLLGGMCANVRDEEGDSAVMYAVRGNHLGILRCLLLAGASVHTRNKQQMTPLMLALQNGNDEAVAMLRDARADTWRDKYRVRAEMIPLQVSTEEYGRAISYLLKRMSETA